MTLSIWNAIGFFIQFFPCAIMIFLPFPQDMYRFRRRRIFSVVTISAILLSLFFAVFMCIDTGIKTALFANLFMLLSILITLAAYFFIVSDSFVKKLLVFFVVMSYAALQYCLVNVLIGFSSDFLNITMTLRANEVYSWYDITLYLITSAFMLPLMLTFLIRILRIYICEVKTYYMRRESFVLIFSTIVFIAMMIYVDVVYYYMAYKSYLLMLMLFFVLLLYQIFIYWLIFHESLQRERDSELQRTVEIQQLQYKKIAEDIENTRKMRHDMRHHYNSLNDMICRGQLDEIKDYLSELIDTTVSHDNKTYCKNMTVNGLLQYYIGIAANENIRCEVQADCDKLSIEASDLTVIFGNALENAINACKKCPDNRWIKLKIGTVQGSLAIEISNSCMGVNINHHLQSEDGFSPAETFLDSHNGVGYGLRSIAHTAQKYGGSAKFRFNAEEGTFTARIRLNMNYE